MWWTQQSRFKFPSFSAESNSLQSATREAKTNPTISYPALPPDQSGEGSGSSTSPYPNGQPPNSFHPFGDGQPSTDTHRAGTLNTMPGSTPMPATVTHTQPSHVAPGTDPLSSPGEAGHPPFRRRWVPLPYIILVRWFIIRGQAWANMHWRSNVMSWHTNHG